MTDMIGRKFGKLTIIEECQKHDKFGNKVYKCKCDCGNIVEVRGNCLKTGNTRSCGCLRGKNHGKTGTALYYTWSSIKQRCYNKNNKRYSDYGARGIKVCQEWLDNFQVFYDWMMDNGYREGLTIDRVDNNKGYSPDNCRLVDKTIQNRNRRNTIMVTYKGKTKPLVEWCESLGLNYSTIRARIYRNWSIEKALEVK